eukprot:scaffold248400_cov42-Prasinocladus_malaysianus.AAC.1
MSSYCNGNVVGLEIAQEMVDRARSRYPHLRFLQLDAVEHLDKLKNACQGANKLFLDLGGNRPMESCVSLLPFLQSEVAPSLIVVKNRELAGFAEQHIQDLHDLEQGDEYRRVGPIPRPSVWWENVSKHVEDLVSVRQRR